jgi:hypothetical protein
MQTAYMIEATSPSLQQTQCQLNLISTENNRITDYELAKKLSDSFAQVLNQNRKEHATDWVGTPRLVPVGGATIPGVGEHNIVYNQQL